MSCWETLGIAADSDKKTIKRAYAKLLKKTRPDDDPDGFKALHSAYKAALAYSAHSTQSHYDYDEGYSESGESRRQDERDNADSASATEQCAEDVVTANSGTFATMEEGGDSPASSEEAVEVTVEATLLQDEVSVPDEPQIMPGEVETTLAVDQLLPAAPLESPLSEETLSALQQTVVVTDENDERIADDWSDEGYFAELDRDWDEADAKAQALVRTPQRVNKVEEWRFIESISSMVDLEFRTRISDHFFGIVAEANEIALEQKALYIKTPVLDYLNGFFHWDQNWGHLRYEHGEDLLDGVFPFLSAGKGENKKFIKGVQTESPDELFYYGRVGAFTLDLLIGLPLALVIGLLEFEPNNYFLAEAIYLLLVVPLLEASRWQASFGKRLMKLVVVNKQGLRIPWYQSFWRSLVTMGCLAGFKIVVWINLYMSWKNNILLQDYVSRSYVVQLRD